MNYLEGYSGTTLLFTAIIALVFGLAGGFLIWSGPGNSPTGAAVVAECPEYSCEYADAFSVLPVIDYSPKQGTGGIIGSNPDIVVSAQNPYSHQGVWAQASIKCKATGKPESILASPEKFIAPGESAEFKFEYVISAGQDWECYDPSATTSVKECKLVQISS